MQPPSQAQQEAAASWLEAMPGYVACSDLHAGKGGPLSPSIATVAAAAAAAGAQDQEAQEGGPVKAGLGVCQLEVDDTGTAAKHVRSYSAVGADQDRPVVHPGLSPMGLSSGCTSALVDLARASVKPAAPTTVVPPGIPAYILFSQ